MNTFHKSRSRILTLITAFLCSIMPSLAIAGGNFIGPVYGRRDTTVVNFPLVTASSATQALYSGATFPAGECKVSTGGSTFANCTNTPSEVATSSGVYRLTLSAAEMNADDVLVKISKGSVYEDVVLLVKTKLDLRAVDVYNSTATAVSIKGAGVGGYGMYVGLSANGSGALFVDGTTNCTGNCYGLVAQGEGSYPGVYAQGGSSGGAGLLVSGGTNGAGIWITPVSGDANGITVAGSGTGSGIAVTAGATGTGMSITGGSTSGTGLSIAAAGGNSIGMAATGFGTGAGFSITGGSGVSSGLRVRADTAVSIQSTAANGIGMSITGTGTGSGLKVIGGTGYAAELVGGTVGLYSSGSSHGIQGSPDIYPVTLGTSVWNEVSGTEPSAGPTWGTSTYGQFLSLAVARYYNKVTQTSSAQTVYKTGGVTVMATGTVSDDGVTQTKGEIR